MRNCVLLPSITFDLGEVTYSPMLDDKWTQWTGILLAEAHTQFVDNGKQRLPCLTNAKVIHFLHTPAGQAMLFFAVEPPVAQRACIGEQGLAPDTSP